MDTLLSLLRTREALVLLAEERWAEVEAGTGSTAAGRGKCGRMLDAIQDPAFWAGVEAVVGHLTPVKVAGTVCVWLPLKSVVVTGNEQRRVLQVAIRILEADSATLDQVLVVFGHLTKHFQHLPDGCVGHLMLTALEKRWAACDQEVCVLACLLNPARRLRLFSPSCPMVSWPNLLSLGKHMVTRLFGAEAAEASSQAFAAELVRYKLGVHPFTAGAHLRRPVADAARILGACTPSWMVASMLPP